MGRERDWGGSAPWDGAVKEGPPGRFVSMFVILVKGEVQAVMHVFL